MTIVPDPGDSSVWSQIVAIVCRMALAFVLWLEYALPLILPAGVAAWLYGRHFGYRGAALRLFVATGMFVAVVGTPATLTLFGLDVDLWKTVVCCALSVFCWEGVRWLKAAIMRRLGIDRRKDTTQGGDDE
ncbi:hypothetical protein LJC59_00945 [Desulfovibrio sp. OttesenSCG-928-A18]|nr:hypothetical protein [Desulfovibrio sp. OttesenSCG-928-A18]